MPANLMDALRALVGHMVTIRAGEETFTGTLASVTNNLVILAASGGVTFIDPGTITAVTTAGGDCR